MIDRDGDFWETTPVKDAISPKTSREWFLRDRIKHLTDGLGFLIEDRDWHGVMDAAADIREMEAELRGLSDGKV